MNECPQCKAATITANLGNGQTDTYCEECGWPDENRKEENFIDPKHPHGPPDPRWITEDGRCLLCADTYHKSRILSLESQLATAQADLESTKVECTILRASGQDEALMRAFVQGAQHALYGFKSQFAKQEARRLLAANLLGVKSSNHPIL